MAFFKDTPDEGPRLDWQILRNGWASLYWQPEILEKDIAWLKKEGYKVVCFDCTNWNDVAAIHSDLRERLEFPGYYGENLDALNDCLAYIDITGAGLVIVFRHFQTVGKNFAHDLLDVFAHNSRAHMLFGNRLLMLVQVDDPSYEIADIGATAVQWNHAEWLKSKRGL